MVVVVVVVWVMVKRGTEHSEEIVEEVVTKEVAVETEVPVVNWVENSVVETMEVVVTTEVLMARV